MKPNENVAKDLAYQQMIYNKLLEIDGRFATLFPYTNMAQDVLEGGTRLREHPLPGVSMETYEPSTLATGGGCSGPQIQRPPQPKLLRKNANIKTLSGGGNNRMELVKKIMKEQGLNLPQASKYIKENDLYKKAEKVVGGGNKIVGGKKVNRLKKAKRWKDFALDTANDGLDLAQRATDPFKHVKNLFGGDVKPKRAPSQWIQFVKQFAAKNGIPYKEALKKAGVEYRKLKG
jgi:hypothetical protein